MNRIGSVVVLVFAMCVAGPVRADDVMVGNLKFTAAWARATPKGATVGGGYFTVTNTGMLRIGWSAARRMFRTDSKFIK